MEHAYYAAFSEVRRLEWKHTGQDPVLVAMTKWEKKLAVTPPAILRLFIDTHYNDLRKMNFILKDHAAFRGHIDRIFKKRLQMDMRLPLSYTLIFKEFIKGITYFASHAGNEVPIYHRLMACGPGTDAFRKEWNQCTLTMKKSNRRAVVERIQSCYIERVIYDNIYRSQSLLFPHYANESGEVTQDDGHLHWLEQTKKDYESCFPGETLAVHMEYDGMWPVELRIERTIPHRPTRMEVFRKNIQYAPDGTKHYGDSVECHRQEGARAWSKAQFFQAPCRWKSVDPQP